MDLNADYTSRVTTAHQRLFANMPAHQRVGFRERLRLELAGLKAETTSFADATPQQREQGQRLVGQMQTIDRLEAGETLPGMPAVNHPGHPGDGATQHGAITYAGTISELVARAGGLHPAHNPRVTIPVGALWPNMRMQAAVTYGGAPLGPPLREDAIVPLGQDRRYLYPVLKTNPLGPTDAVVQWVTETARSLASTSSMIRAIDATSTKPESAATLALTTLTLKQVATKISTVPNILFRQTNPDLQGYLNGVLRLALAEALDAEAITAVSGASLSTGGTGSTMAERIRKAMTTLESAGYNPDTVVLSPTDSEALDLELLATLNSSNTLPNWRLNVRISKSTTTGLVLDSSVFATLHAGPIEIAAFEENFGQSNTVTVRGELNAQVSIDQAGAAVAIGASA